MPVRPFDLLDLPFLPRYRKHVVSLDSARHATRGNPLGAAALLSYLDPRRHIYTAVNSSNGANIIGQMVQAEGQTYARLTFLTPADRVEAAAGALLDHLAGQAGTWGVHNLLAEVDEGHPALRSLRQAGFAMYAWQRVWKMATHFRGIGSGYWESPREQDLLAIQSLYCQIVPALMQPVEPLPRQIEGRAYHTENGLQAYAAVTDGPAGIWIQPLIPPDSECSAAMLASLAQNLVGRGRRPVYICVRSYQAWLESILEETGAKAGPRQAVLVKRLAILKKAEQPVQAVESALPKPAAPAAQTDSS